MNVYYGSISLIDTESLSHHGILGQKWGKRNGPPYPLDQEDHSKSEQKAGWQKSLSKGSESTSSKAPATKKKPSFAKRAGNFFEETNRENYIMRGVDPKTARAAAKDKRKLMRNVAIGVGAAAAVGLGVYFYTQYGRNVVDDVIKEGTTIQTLSHDVDRMEMGQAFYTAINDADKEMYIGLFGQDRDPFFGMPIGESKKVLTAAITKDIKVAGDKTASKVFNDLMKNDASFRQWYDFDVKEGANAFGIMANMNGQLQNKYQGFNRYALLSLHDSYSEKQIGKFYNKLKELGYGAVNDVNDRKFSFFNTKACIVFDRTNIEKTVSGDLNVKIRDLTDDELFKDSIKANIRGVVNQMLAPIGIGGMSIISLGATAAFYDKRVVNGKYKQKKRSEKNE